MDTAKYGLLRDGWTRQLAALGVSAGAVLPAFADLVAHYTSAGRYYHTLDHIHAMLDTVRALGGTDAMAALQLAVWFHDVIYDTRTKDNEERSAAHARCVLQPLGVPEEILRETERLILLTKTHCPAASDQSGQLLVDADLAILGAGPIEYDAYTRAIRQEYAWVPEVAYRSGRRDVLKAFLSRPRIFSTHAMFMQREQAARRNLQHEIEELTPISHQRTGAMVPQLA